MGRIKLLASLLLLATATGCNQAADAQTTPSATPQASEQIGQGEPYQMSGTQVWTVPDTLEGRSYQVYVALPAGYEDTPQRRYPVLYVTDAHYAFPIVRQLSRRMNLDGPVIRDHILVGLSYAVDDDPVRSRTRDYTPSARRNAAKGAEGGGPSYQAWLKSSAIPFVESKFRTDQNQRVLLGHSFGSLLATQILFSDPDMFSHYVLGSPSLWFNGHQMFEREAAYAAANTDLKAKIYMYIGAEEVGRYDMVGDNRRLEQALLSRNYPSLELKSDVISAEDHLTVAPIGFMRALETLLPAQ